MPERVLTVVWMVSLSRYLPMILGGSLIYNVLTRKFAVTPNNLLEIIKLEKCLFSSDTTTSILGVGYDLALQVIQGLILIYFSQ